MNLGYTTLDKVKKVFKQAMKYNKEICDLAIELLSDWRGNIVIVDNSDPYKTVFIEGAGVKRNTLSLIDNDSHTCEQCEIPFTPEWNDEEGRFCSEACEDKYNNIHHDDGVDGGDDEPPRKGG
jgi:RNA polymerase subunit RPABC4/transcription elongation factor Spt4